MMPGIGVLPAAERKTWKRLLSAATTCIVQWHYFTSNPAHFAETVRDYFAWHRERFAKNLNSCFTESCFFFFFLGALRCALEHCFAR